MRVFTVHMKNQNQSNPAKKKKKTTWCCHTHYFPSRKVLVSKTVGDEKKNDGAKC